MNFYLTLKVDAHGNSARVICTILNGSNRGTHLKIEARNLVIWMGEHPDCGFDGEGRIMAVVVGGFGHLDKLTSF